MSVYSKERAEWLRASLESVFRQTVPPSEVVLVEDGPLTGELEAVVREFETAHGEMRVIRSPENRGLGRALNLGLRHCAHELVARMDSDDICKPDRFERQLRVFDERPEVDVCSAWMEEFVTDPSAVTAVKRLPSDAGALYEYGKRRNPVNHPVAMFRKRAVIENGSYRDYPLFEDYFLWVRMLTGGCRFHTVQAPLLSFRASADMYARRGGWRYAATEFRLQLLFYGLRYIGFATLAKNLAVRFPVRLLPRPLRSRIYRRGLRAKL